MPLTRGKIRELRDLGRKKGREASGHFIVDGVRGVREALRSSFPLLELFYTGTLLADVVGNALVEEAQKRTHGVHAVTPREMEQISDTVTAQGVLAVMQRKEWAPADVLRKGDSASVIVALDAVADPGNLGAIVRTCDWFGVDALILGEGCVEPYNPKVVRSTVGSIFHLPILVDIGLPSLVSQVKEFGYTVYAAAADGVTYTDDVQYAQKSCLLLGSEAWGISEPVMQAADVCLAIRRHGAAESLNVGVACGILLAGLRKR
jgi:RNA methyltransferase, TrmH family